MGTPETFIICDDCDAVMTNHSATAIDVEYSETEHDRVLTTPAYVCQLCASLYKSCEEEPEGSHE